MPKKKPTNHYLDNERFTKEVTLYAEKARDSIESGEEPEPMNEYIGKSLLDMARKMSNRANFCGYTFKEEMISDAIEDTIKYLKNFDPKKAIIAAKEKAESEGKDPSKVNVTPSAFAYVSRIMWFAFLRRLKKEEKQFDLRQKLITNAGLIDDISNIQDHDENQYVNQYLDNFKSMADDYYKLGQPSNEEEDEYRLPSEVRKINPETMEEFVD